MEEEKKEGDLLLPNERREYPRVGVNIKVKYRVLDATPEDNELVKRFDPEKIFQKTTETQAVDVSTCGLQMFTEEFIPLKSFVAVNMYIPLPGLSCSCKVLGEVIRIEKLDMIHRVGVKFLKVLHHDLNKYKYTTLKDLLEIDGEPIKHEKLPPFPDSGKEGSK